MKSSAPNPKVRNGRLIVFGVCLLLIVAVWLVFGQTLGHAFVNYDDDVYVYKNPRITSGLSVNSAIWAFTHSHAHNWHPLTTISHLLDCELFALKPGGPHLTNVLLHSVAAVLLFLVFSNMTGVVWRSGFVALIFAIHPLRAESVAWIAERKDVLSGVFFMLTLAAYVRYARRPSVGSYLIVAFVYALALMSKPMVVTMPFVLLLLDYWPLGRFTSQTSPGTNKKVGQVSNLSHQRKKHKRPSRQSPARKLFLEKIPFLLLACICSFVTISIQSHGLVAAEKLPVLLRLYNALLSYMTYLRQLFWPAHLAVFYPYHLPVVSIWQAILVMAVLSLITYLAWIVRKQYPYVIVGWLWYLVMLLPVIGIIQVGQQSHADRYTYLPHIGLIVLATWLVADLTRSWSHRGAILAVAGGAAIIVFGLCAWKQTSYWKNSETLWSHTLAFTSGNYVAHQNIGEALLEDRKSDEAIGHFRKALRLRPNDAKAHSSLATALFTQSDRNAEEAFAHWEQSLRLDPANVNARDRFGVALAQQGRLRDAIAQWQESLRYDDADGNAQYKIAWVLATASDSSLRDGALALQLAQSVAQRSSKNPVVFRVLAAAYAENGRFHDAISAAGQGLRLAEEQRNSDLVAEFQKNLALYKANKPLRDDTLANSTF